jgi:hypothetical protein
MTDDVFSARMIFMVHGQACPQLIKPHDDLMAVFPFLGMPHPQRYRQTTPTRWDPSRKPCRRYDMTEPSLYERLGGAFAIAAVIDHSATRSSATR